MKETFEGWAILELMGHRRLGGYVTDVELFGVRKIRIDVPGVGDDGQATGTQATQYYSPESMYALTPVTEEVALAIARRVDPAPIKPWEMPRPALPAGDVEDAEVEEAVAAFDDDDEELVF